MITGDPQVEIARWKLEVATCEVCGIPCPECPHPEKALLCAHHSDQVLAAARGLSIGGFCTSWDHPLMGPPANLATKCTRSVKVTYELLAQTCLVCKRGDHMVSLVWGYGEEAKAPTGVMEDELAAWLAGL